VKVTGVQHLIISNFPFFLPGTLRGSSPWRSLNT